MGWDEGGGESGGEGGEGGGDGVDFAVGEVAEFVVSGGVDQEGLEF